MGIVERIKSGVKDNKIIMGYERVLTEIKTKRPTLVIYANDLPDEKRREIEHNAKVAKVRLEKYPDDGISLGLVCGKPFPVGVLAIKKGSKR